MIWEFWEDKKVMITGSEGLVGKELMSIMRDLKCDVMGFDIKNGWDLRDYSNCQALVGGFKPDVIFHCAGIKGSPKMTQLKPLSFMEPMLQFDLNMIKVARENKVKYFLYSSSIAVNFPEKDKYPAWAKSTAEKLIEATRIEYPNCETKYVIVRPSSIYGRFDDFTRDNPMVIPSMINNALNNKLELWGEGKQTRDFINARDVALGMIKVIEEMPDYPVNLCSGTNISIKELAEKIANFSGTELKIVPTDGKIIGSENRPMNRNFDNPITVSLDDGLKEAIEHAKMVTSIT